MIRLTPGIECHTHDYIRTGSIDSKFGFDLNQLDQVFNFSSNIQSCLALGYMLTLAHRFLNWNRTMIWRR